MGSPPTFDPRTIAELLAEAERFEKLAKAVENNSPLNARLLALAADARARARLVERSD
jgi:hypothetical protein